MSYRAHVQTKHEIEYGNCHFNWDSDRVADWLLDNGVIPCGTGDDYDFGPEWELDKAQLRDIPETAFRPIGSDEEEITADELRAFVRDLIAAPTGEYAYVSWF